MSNLMISDELKSIFSKAQDGTYRWIKVEISGETFMLTHAFNRSPSVKEDFHRLQDQVALDTASLFLFCKDTNVSALRWIMIAYVPDTCAVRERMLYSSSRESLKKGLGYNYFTAEFQATQKEELSFDAFWNAEKTMLADAPLTESEKLVREESRMERDTSVKSSAMGIIPFQLSDDLKKELSRLKSKDTLWIEMVLNLENESVQLSKTKTLMDLKKLVKQMDSENPCFIAYQDDNAYKWFIFFCPENAPVRLKMTYSSCKATVVASASNLDISFDRMIEIHHSEDFMDDITVSDGESTTTVTNSRPAFSKPAAPGRGRRARGGSSITRRPVFQSNA